MPLKCSSQSSPSSTWHLGASPHSAQRQQKERSTGLSSGDGFQECSPRVCIMAMHLNASGNTSLPSAVGLLQLQHNTPTLGSGSREWGFPCTVLEEVITAALQPPEMKHGDLQAGRGVAEAPPQNASLSWKKSLGLLIMHAEKQQARGENLSDVP